MICEQKGKAMRFKVEINEGLTGRSATKFYQGRPMRQLTVRGVEHFDEQLFHFHVPEEQVGVEVGKEIEIEVGTVVSGHPGHFLLLGSLTNQPNESA